MTHPDNTQAAGKTTKSEKQTMTGASILWECLEREGVTGGIWLSRRSHSAGL